MALKTNWKVRVEGPIIEVVDGNNANVCILDREARNSVSNAMLIASAPLLLWALKKCLEHGLSEHTDACITDTVDTALAVIKLIEGGGKDG